MLKLLIRIYLFTSITAFASWDAPEVKISQGTLRGTYRKSWKQKTFSAFTGIPYAKPPIGTLRFKPAVSAESWNGVLDASKSHSVCPQMNIFLNDSTVRGDEDCLYLNVYTPQLVGSNNKLFPVMFFIHGGGFFSGSANPELYGPDYLLDKEVVLVTINYRLGALGFLSTEDQIIPGNNGLKDQNVALRWVKKNIACFGGNPEKITVFGQSAGGASTHFHMLSPLSRDLINGAIAHSGIGNAMWALAPKGQAERNAKKLAKFLNCPTISSRDIVECLRKINAYDIVEQEKNFMVFGYDPLVPFKPVIEPNIGGAFLSEDPIDAIKSGKSANIPFVTGLTTEDGSIKSAVVYNDSNLLEELNRDFNVLAPIIFQYEETVNKNEITKRLKKFYFGDGNIDDSKKAELTNLFTDAFSLSPQNAAVRLHAQYLNQPVYYYMFGYRGSSSFTSLFGDPSHDYGVCHGDELLYLFNNKLFTDDEPTATDCKFIDIMTTLWTNFAATGNPTPETSSLIKSKWQPVPSNSLSYYFIKSDNDIRMADDLYSGRAEFWKNLATQPRQNRINEEL